MTEKQKESIEILKEHYIKHNYYDDDTISVATIRVLDLIQERQEAIEKKDIDIIETKEANRQLSVELQKKDKIINEIAEELGNQYINHEPCDLDGKINCKKYKNCKECVKQYFEKKVGINNDI